MIIYWHDPEIVFIFQTIMKDRWMNIGYEDDELQPYVEPDMDYGDIKRIEILSEMGYLRTEIEESLKSQKYDDVYATYLLLGRRSSDVGITVLMVLSAWFIVCQRAELSEDGYRYNYKSQLSVILVYKSYIYF